MGASSPGYAVARHAGYATASAPTAAVAWSASGPQLGARPAWFRPVVVDGRSFPLARSNFLSYIHISSNWHAPRLRFEGGKWRLVGVHEGIDIGAERGTPILSVAAGTVEAIGWTFYSGMRVGVRGYDGRYYFYAHLSAVAPGLVEGARVEAGSLLGRVGNTGYGAPGERDQFPPHLHFGIEADGEWVNPYALLVSLYDATVRADVAAERRLDELAAAGDRDAWDELADRVYTDFGAPVGE